MASNKVKVRQENNDVSIYTNTQLCNSKYGRQLTLMLNQKNRCGLNLHLACSGFTVELKNSVASKLKQVLLQPSLGQKVQAAWHNHFKLATVQILSRWQLYCIQNINTVFILYTKILNEANYVETFQPHIPNMSCRLRI